MSSDPDLSALRLTIGTCSRGNDMSDLLTLSFDFDC